MSSEPFVYMLKITDTATCWRYSNSSTILPISAAAASIGLGDNMSTPASASNVMECFELPALRKAKYRSRAPGVPARMSFARVMEAESPVAYWYT